VPWVLWLLWDPPAALDLVDKEGRVDHGKIIGVLAFASFVTLILRNALPPLGHTIVLYSGVFGWVGMRTFLASRTATSTETITTALEVGSERDPDDGRE
jgi:hypothetical protein